MTGQEFLPAAARRTTLAFGLRTATVLQIALIAGVIGWRHGPNAASIATLGVIFAVWLAVPATLAVLTFVIKWMLGDWPARVRGSWRHWLPTALVETGWMMRMYLLDQSWRRPPVSAVGADSSRTPVLLVHGFLCNGSVWHALAKHLDVAQRGFAVVSLQPTYRHFQQQLVDLDGAVQALCARTGKQRVLLLGHSMGGLLVRAYAERDPARCAGVICVAAPHHGTYLGDLIHGIEYGPPSPRCQWLQQFNTRSVERIDIAALNLWSADDNIVIPAVSSQLAATPECTLHGHGHMALIAAPAACAALVAALNRLESPAELMQ